MIKECLAMKDDFVRVKDAMAALNTPSKFIHHIGSDVKDNFKTLESEAKSMETLYEAG